jgi:protein-S-isoprenylcysteine O-methyltransferase Ste14
MIPTYIILLAASSIFIVVEGALLWRDIKRAKGTTRLDRMSRISNAVAFTTALFSAAAVFLLPGLNFHGGEPCAALTVAGAVLICLGFGLRYWAVAVLGRHFRTTVEIDKDQTIVQTGPYRFIRHPSYAGALLFFTGYGLVSQNVVALLACLLLPAAALVYRIKVEEEAFIRELGKAYKDYRSRTKRLIPGIW